MSIEKNERTVRSEYLDTLPEVKLDCAIDERSDPPEVTIFDPDGEQVATAWITASGDAVVSLDQLQ